ncbi:hypothetical protein PROFUN_15437 [Planoprotostelium fungivorum]|uniref:Uncharacterized protein n=1 Tax=Planoprotostelium fungivorum TaxID=1890364 RepID=A0A2P6MWN5_9EUKA|nr:hypothetical protein PROFUN_15437 [Planoprotostelium fungivorum]
MDTPVRRQEWDWILMTVVTCDETASHRREEDASEQESNNKTKDIASMKTKRRRISKWERNKTEEGPVTPAPILE